VRLSPLVGSAEGDQRDTREQHGHAEEAAAGYGSARETQQSVAVTATEASCWPATVSTTTAAAPISGMSEKTAVTYVAPQIPPSQPHQGTARSGATWGRGAPVARMPPRASAIAAVATVNENAPTAIAASSSASS
jgi:hypothetical protein